MCQIVVVGICSRSFSFFFTESYNKWYMEHIYFSPAFIRKCISIFIHQTAAHVSEIYKHLAVYYIPLHFLLHPNAFPTKLYISQAIAIDYAVYYIISNWFSTRRIKNWPQWLINTGHMRRNMILHKRHW